MQFTVRMYVDTLQIELEFRNVGFEREGETKLSTCTCSGEKTSQSKDKNQ